MKKNIGILFAVGLVFFSACAPKIANNEQNNELNNNVQENSQAVVNEVEESVNQPEIIEPTEEVFSLTVVDDAGTEITFSEYPSKIISVSSSITESLFAIGAGDLIVGRDDYSLYPSEVESIEIVGSFFGGVPLEAMVALEPDLVIAAETISLEQVASMQEVGLVVYWQKNPTNFEGLYANLIALGEITNTLEETKAITASLENRVSVIIDTLVGVEILPLVFYELDATDVDNPWTTGGDTFISLVISLAGGINVGDAVEGEWVQISSEVIIENNPEIILLADAEWGVTIESVQSRVGWDVISAVIEGNIFPIDSNLFSIPGPRLVDGLEILAELLHPELFD